MFLAFTCSDTIKTYWPNHLININGANSPQINDPLVFESSNDDQLHRDDGREEECTSSTVVPKPNLVSEPRRPRRHIKLP